MDTAKILEELIREPGISGHENDFANDICNKLKKYCEDVKINKTGSVIGLVRGAKTGRKTILLEAHLDRIGLAVSEITDEGFLKFRTLGGVDERILPASEVYILGREKCFGVIGALPPHLRGDSDDKGKCARISDMLIDTGLTKAEAEKAFSVGDPILMISDFSTLLDGRVSSAALDNRAGMASIFECLEMINDTELDVNVCVAFTVGEELGLQGARTLIKDEKIDFAVVVDVTHAKTADSTDSDTFPLGCGTVICRGPNLHYEKTNEIIDTAKKEGIPYEIEVLAGNTGTNAWALQIAGDGIPCALISIPLRFMHTTVETVDIKDIENVARLLSKVLQGGVSFD